MSTLRLNFIGYLVYHSKWSNKNILLIFTRNNPASQIPSLIISHIVHSGISRRCRRHHILLWLRSRCIVIWSLLPTIPTHRITWRSCYHLSDRSTTTPSPKKLTVSLCSQLQPLLSLSAVVNKAKNTRSNASGQDQETDNQDDNDSRTIKTLGLASSHIDFFRGTIYYGYRGSELN